ncbi:MAG: sulfite exporter TauE/SafE family protein [Bacteroidales bacterium]
MAEIEFLANQNIYSWEIVSILIVAGFLVGFINTIAGSGTVITYSLFMMLGMPANVANGTIRLGVVMQTLVAGFNFKKHKFLDLKKGFKLGTPVVIGSILGAQIAANINETIFEKILAIVLLIMLVLIFYDPKRWLKDQIHLIHKKPDLIQVMIFFGIGLYGGFIHIGVGILLLSAIVLNAGYDLVKANAIKIMIVFLYSPFALGVFMINSQVDYQIGLISAIGNVIGGFVGSNMAMFRGNTFVRAVLITVMALFAAYLLDIPRLIS